jgi:hypothetical protein
MQYQLFLIAALSCSSIAMAQKSFTEEEVKSLLNAMTTTTAGPIASHSSTSKSASSTSVSVTISASTTANASSTSSIAQTTTSASTAPTTPTATEASNGANAEKKDEPSGALSAGLTSISLGIFLAGLLL